MPLRPGLRSSYAKQREQSHSLNMRYTRLSSQWFRLQVSAAEQRCTTSTQQCMHFQRLSEERLQRLQATETATADANNRAAAAVATAGDLQRQLSGTIRQRDDFSRLVSEWYARLGHLDAPIPASNKAWQHISFITMNSSGWKCNHYRTVPVGLAC